MTGSWSRVGPLLVAACIGGCGGALAPVTEAADLAPDASSLGAEILAEFRTLTTLLTPTLLLYIVTVALVALGLRRTIAWVVRFAWRLRLDPRRNLARIKGALDLGVVVVAAVLAVRPLFLAVPLVFAVMVSIGGLIAAIALPEWIQNVVAGLALTTRGQFREGDRIEVGGATGAVERVGLLRTRLRTTDGSAVSLPNRDLLRLALRVGEERSAMTVSVEIPPDRAHCSQERERLLRRACLWPYRRTGERPRIEQRDGRWMLTAHTWCTADPTLAQHTLHTLVEGDAASDATGRATEPRRFEA